MLPEFDCPGKGPIKLQTVTATGNDNRLPGGILQQRKDKEGTLSVQQFQHPLFSIGSRLLRCLKRCIVSIRERQPGLRLEAVLAGELVTAPGESSPVHISAGQYRVTNNPAITALFKKGSACHYFVTHYSHEFLQQAGIAAIVTSSPVKTLSGEMKSLIQQVLHNPYEQELRTFHYDNCVRQIMLAHLNNPTGLPGELNDADLVKIFAADSLLRHDLISHENIGQLAKKVNSNEFKLKRGFRQQFNMGVFERLTFHRMEHAKWLLSTGNRTIDDIAGLVGYGTRNSFITAFKRNVKQTPHQWRKSRQERS